MLASSRSTTRATEVDGAIRADIISGHLEPGERLAFAALVERYRSSIGVIRERRQRLTEQGFVESPPKYGFSVITVSADDQEITDTAASATLGELCGRAARVELFEGHARSGDVRAYKYAGAPLPWAPASLRSLSR